MKSIKKMTVALFAAVALVGLVSCGDKGEKKAESKTETTAEAKAETPAAPAKVTATSLYEDFEKAAKAVNLSDDDAEAQMEALYAQFEESAAAFVKTLSEADMAALAPEFVIVEGKIETLMAELEEKYYEAQAAKEADALAAATKAVAAEAKAETPAVPEKVTLASIYEDFEKAAKAVNLSGDDVEAQMEALYEQLEESIAAFAETLSEEEMEAMSSEAMEVEEKVEALMADLEEKYEEAQAAKKADAVAAAVAASTDYAAIYSAYAAQFAASLATVDYTAEDGDDVINALWDAYEDSLSSLVKEPSLSDYDDYDVYDAAWDAWYEAKDAAWDVGYDAKDAAWDLWWDAQ